jgi:hypothetical protein
MSQRVSLPSSLSNQQVSPSTLQRSGEGVTLANQPTIPNQSGSSLSSQAARTIDMGNATTSIQRPVGSLRTTTASATLSPNQETADYMVSTGSSLPEVSNVSVGNLANTQTASEVKEGWAINFDATYVVIIILVPIIIWLILYSTKFNFCTDLINGDRVINTSKLILWTLIVSIVVWIIIWLCYSAYTRGKVAKTVSTTTATTTI